MSPVSGSALMTEFTISAVEGFADEVTQLPLVYVFRRHQGGNSNLLNIIPSTDNQIKVTLPAGTSQNTHWLIYCCCWNIALGFETTITGKYIKFNSNTLFLYVYAIILPLDSWQKRIDSISMVCLLGVDLWQTCVYNLHHHFHGVPVRGRPVVDMCW